MIEDYTKTLFDKIESYLNGNMSAEDFSYDFPVAYALYARGADFSSPEVSDFFERVVVDICKRYDPYDMYSIAGEKITKEEDFKKKIRECYEKGLTLGKEENCLD